MNTEKIKNVAIETGKVTLKTVASIYVLQNNIKNTFVETACNIVNKYVFKDDTPMF